MHNKLLTRIIALSACAIMSFGVITVVAMAPVTVVEAADAATTKAIKAEFDAKFYATKYADVKQVIGTNADALYKHFVNFGMKEGRMMNSKFDPKAYIEAYPDIKAYCNGDYTKAYEHYVNNGKKENRTLTTFEAINAKKAAENAAAEAQRKEQERQKQLEEQKKKEQEKQNQNKNNNTTNKTTVNNTYITVISTYSVSIGHGLVLTLTDDQYDYCEITVLSNGNGYGAYIGSTCYATTYGYNEDDAYPYSSVTVINGNVSENVFAPQYKEHYDEILDREPEDKNDVFFDDDDDVDDVLALALLLAELDDDD